MAKSGQAHKTCDFQVNVSGFPIRRSAAVRLTGLVRNATLDDSWPWDVQMQVENGKVAVFHYVVRDADAAETAPPVDSSRDRGEPLAIMVGRGGLIAGVESALRGKAAGERFDVRVAPEDGYGVRDEAAVQRVPKKFFAAPDRLRPGQMTTLSTRDGDRPVTVLKVGMSVVDVDVNHPLAGKTLAFEIEMVDVRDPTPDELSHGHAHGADGHAGH